MGDVQVKRKGPIRRFFGALGRGILVLIFIGIITGSIVISVLAMYIFNSLEGAPVIDLNDIQLSNTSLIYADNPETGEPEVVVELFADKNREWIDYSKIPQDVINTVVAAEDKRYWDHHGVDWVRTVASTLTFFTGSDTQGGSTITQQVIKNVTNDDEFSPERKVREIFMALKLDKQYTKEQILESYLNVAYFGNHCYGIQSAATFYFGKPLSELNIAEIATIIATTNAPTLYDPLRKANPDRNWEDGLSENKVRRNYIIDEMVKLEYVTPEDATKWKNFDVQMNVTLEEGTSQGRVYNWFEDQVIRDVINDLQEKLGYTRAHAYDYLYSAGLRIFSTEDQTIQDRLEEQYKDPATFPKINNSDYPETAAVVMTPDGAVRGLIGGNEKSANLVLNRATMSMRHPGSTMKPISAYLNAFEMDMITWSTMFHDAPIDAPGERAGETFKWPINYYPGYIPDPITVQYAVMRSVNTIPAQLVQLLTPQVCYDFLKNKFQISTLSENDIALSPMALGGMTYGLYPIELVGTYQIFVTGGLYVKPYTYTRVTDMEGNIVLQKDTTQVRVVSEETATVLNRILQTVVQSSGGTGGAANRLGMPTGGKTGSSTGSKRVNGVDITINDPDLWFVGFTPYYIAGVWMGYDIPEQIHYSSYPTPILWANLMKPIHENLEKKDFEYSPNVKQMTYCTVSGDIATANCPTTAAGWYKDTFIPSNCSLHRAGGVVVDEQGNPVTDDEPSDSGDSGNSASDSEEPEDSDDGGIDITNRNSSPKDDDKPKVIVNPKNRDKQKSEARDGVSDNSDSLLDKFFG